MEWNGNAGMGAAHTHMLNGFRWCGVGSMQRTRLADGGSGHAAI